MNNLEKQYREHYKLYSEIVESINKTSELINKLGELPKTGVENIDNLHLALARTQSKVLEIFEPVEE